MKFILKEFSVLFTFFSHFAYIRFSESFDTHPFNVTEKIDVIDDFTNYDGLELRVRKMLFTIKNSPVWVLMIQIGSSYIAYIFAKFASKVQIQGIGQFLLIIISF